MRFLQVKDDLAALALYSTSAQGLPGILGRDGWLARSPITCGTFIRDIPYLTTAIRLDIHFWWNAIEMTLSLFAAHFFLKDLGRPESVPAVPAPGAPVSAPL